MKKIMKVYLFFCFIVSIMCIPVLLYYMWFALIHGLFMIRESNIILLIIEITILTSIIPGIILLFKKVIYTL